MIHATYRAQLWGNSESNLYDIQRDSYAESGLRPASMRKLLVFEPVVFVPEELAYIVVVVGYFVLHCNEAEVVVHLGAD